MRAIPAIFVLAACLSGYGAPARAQPASLLSPPVQDRAAAS